MMSFLADTNILSEMRKKVRNPAVSVWLDSIPVEHLFTSEVSFAEIRYCIAHKDNAREASELTLWLERDLRPKFADQVLGVDEDILLRWRQISREAQVKRLPTPPADLLIASIAMEYDLTVATRDIAPFVGAGVPTLNPWTGERFNGA